MKCRGFTLLELLIALAIFGFIAAMAYGGLSTVLKAEQETERQAARLASLETALLLLGRDLAQASGRGIRDEFGDPQPALRGSDEGPLELTRAGWANPAGQRRSSLQRVSWALDDDTLVRAGWIVLDRAQDSTAYSQPLLEGVREFDVRFLAANGEWHDSWPPPAALSAGTTGNTASPDERPRAVEVSLELEDWGNFRRLFEVPGA